MSQQKERLSGGLHNPVVTSTRDLVDALAAGYPPERIILAPPSSDIEQARASGFQDGYDKGCADLKARVQAARDEGANAARMTMVNSVQDGIPLEVREAIALAERSRILQIQSITQDGFERLAAECIADGTSAESFAVKLLKDKKDRGITLEAIRNDAPVAAEQGGKPSPLYGTPGDASPTSERREAFRKIGEAAFANRQG